MVRENVDGGRIMGTRGEDVTLKRLVWICDRGSSVDIGAAGAV
jgi:hypothetical protein